MTKPYNLNDRHPEQSEGTQCVRNVTKKVKSCFSEKTNLCNKNDTRKLLNRITERCSE